jgi:predicted esterase
MVVICTACGGSEGPRAPTAPAPGATAVVPVRAATSSASAGTGSAATSASAASLLRTAASGGPPLASGTAHSGSAREPSGSAPSSDALPSRWPAIDLPAARSSWCTEGLATLDAHSCFILPTSPTRTLLIYLHGIVPPSDESPEKTKVQSVILKSAQRAGVVTLVPRGRPGFGPLGRRDWVGWPTTDELYAKYASELVGEFAREQKRLESLTGITFSRVYLAGSSSGAYFVTRLALRGGIDVDGFGAISGGTGMETMELARLAPKPFYIGYGKYDGHVRRAIPTLVGVLTRAHWPLRVAEHPVDHGAREVYLEEAFAFWREHGR